MGPSINTAAASRLPAGSSPRADATEPGRALDQAIASAERVAADRPADLRTQLQLRMLYLAAGRAGDARAAWPSGSADQQRTRAAWVEAAVALGDGAAATGAVTAGGGYATDPADAALAAVERLRNQLAAGAPVRVRTVRLASRVDGFGVVTPFAQETYQPGQWVIVYSELDNLTSRPDTDGQFRTDLSLRVEILTADGRSVLQQEDKHVVDRSLNQRRDFFLARRLRMPADLAAGQYVLRVSVEDQGAAKVGESMLRFEVK
jgi:hypothetical protein